MQLVPLEILGLSIKRLQYRNYRALDAVLAPLGISLVQWSALREIERNPGLCMHGLAELTYNSDQAFGTLMTRLLRQKLVERKAGVGRANVHRVTARGKTLFEEGRKLVRKVLLKTFSPLDADELARLQDLLTKVLGEIPEYGAGSRPVVRSGGRKQNHTPEPPAPARIRRTRATARRVR